MGSTNGSPVGAATGSTGTVTEADFDVTLSGSSGNNGTATVRLRNNITDVKTLISDIRDDLLASGIGVDVREDPANAGRLQFLLDHRR